MNYKEAIEEIIEVLPACKEEFTEVYKTNNSFMVINTFTRHIRNLINGSNPKILEKSLHKMNDLYEKGDFALRNAIENIFVYALDSMTFNCDQKNRKMVFSEISSGLNNKYLHQVYKSGI